MIQRVQSLYWFLAAVLLAVFYFASFAYIKTPEGAINLSVWNGVVVDPAGSYDFALSFWPLHVVVLLALFATLITIFCFKRRALQLRLSGIAMVLDLGVLGLSYFYYRTLSGQVEGLSSLSIVYLLPLIAAILTLLGFLGVKKDIAILRSLSRL